jgi:hypothetical protein
MEAPFVPLEIPTVKIDWDNLVAARQESQPVIRMNNTRP